MVMIDDVVAGVGPAVLTVVIAGAADAVVTDVVVADPGTDDLGGPDDLVLGAGVAAPDAAAALVRACAGRGAPAVVLGAHVAGDRAVRTAAEAAGVWLVGVRPSVSWVQLVWLLRSVVASGEADGLVGGDAGVLDDLFGVADAVAAIIDAPVTIEDSQSRVLAYSRGQDSSDPVRHSTIVGRRVPAPVLAHFRGQGVFRRLTSSDEPLFVPAEGDVRARFVFPVRAGEEWLGSVWAVVDEPVAPHLVAEVRRITAALAVHLLRVRAQADLVRRTAEAELARFLQEPSATASLPAASGAALGAAPWRVALLATLQPDAGDPRRDLELWRTSLRRHGWAEPRLCLVHDRVHAVVGADEGAPEDGTRAGTWAWLVALVADLHRSDPVHRAAAGGAVSAVADLPRSREEAAEAYAVLGELACTTHEESWAARVLARVRAAVTDAAPTGPVARLVEHDRTHGTAYVVTLGAHLRWPGRPRAAAAELDIHPNTLRQRMARIGPLLDVDLDDPAVRLALQVQMTALSPHADENSF